MGDYTEACISAKFISIKKEIDRFFAVYERVIAYLLVVISLNSNS